MTSSLAPIILRGFHYCILFCLVFSLGYGVAGYGSQPTEEANRIWMQGILCYLGLLAAYLALVWSIRRILRRLFPRQP